MDRQIEPTGRRARTIGWVVAVALAASAALYWLVDMATNRTLRLDNSRLVISEVVRGEFDDFIPVRGRVSPRKTVYLDVIEGGRVEQRLVEDGALVTAGQLLVVLNNTSMQLDVTRNEAMVTEQLNDMRSIELQLEQNRLAHKRNLVEINYQIQRLRRQVVRLKNLDSAGLAIRSQLEDAEDELAYFLKRKEVTLESQATDADMQETQLEFLATSSTHLEANLELARANLEALNVRAPVAGKLSGLDVEVGQSVTRGGRLGQIDDPENFKLRAAIDEFYLGRVDIGLRAVASVGGKSYPLIVRKIYPQVRNGQFEIDLEFSGEEPSAIRRGQTLQVTLKLGEPTPAVIIPNGSFYQDTGGNWMFVLNPAGDSANKRNVRLGRRNSDFIEVLEGLEPGERVVTSPYSSFKDMDVLQLSSD